MVWGTFTAAHIISLIIAVIINVAIYFILKNKSEKVQIITLLILSSAGIIAIIYNLVAWNSPLEYLPLHMCNINGMLIPIALITKNKKIGNLLLLWSIGALIALVVNHMAQDFELFSPIFLQYYLSHIFEFGVPILIFALKIIPLDAKTIPSTLIISFIILVVIHCINLALNRYIEINDIRDWKGDLIIVNYMFTIYPDNPVLQFFYNLIPLQFIYVLPIFPIFALYLLLIYTPIIIKEKRKGRA
jgi:uncharacterized membrane protein YwaF